MFPLPKDLKTHVTRKSVNQSSRLKCCKRKTHAWKTKHSVPFFWATVAGFGGVQVDGKAAATAAFQDIFLLKATMFFGPERYLVGSLVPKNQRMGASYLDDHPRTCKWLITMVIVSPLNGVIPLINCLNGL